MKKAVILIFTVWFVCMLMNCRTQKFTDSNQVYNFLSKKAKILFEKEDRLYDDFEKKYRKIVNTTINDLKPKELTKLFDEFIENRKHEIGSAVALSAIISQFSNIRTQESADNVLKIYFKHRNYFDAGNALNLICVFKELDNLCLIAFDTVEKLENDFFLMEVKDIIENDKPCI